MLLTKQLRRAPSVQFAGSRERTDVRLDDNAGRWSNGKLQRLAPFSTAPPLERSDDAGKLHVVALHRRSGRDPTGNSDFLFLQGHAVVLPRQLQSRPPAQRELLDSLRASKLQQPGDASAF